MLRFFFDVILSSIGFICSLYMVLLCPLIVFMMVYDGNLMKSRRYLWVDSSSRPSCLVG